MNSEHSKEPALTSSLTVLATKASHFLTKSVPPSAPSLESLLLMEVASLNCPTNSNGLTPGWYVCRMIHFYVLILSPQNLGVVIAFGSAFIIALLVFTEFNSSSTSVDTPVTKFKRGSRRAIRATGHDEESGAVGEKYTEKPSSPTAAKIVAPKMTDIFLWRNVTYIVPIPGKEDRMLLADVSGYVAPGKLTALMGESGAGKTTLLNVLAQRTDTGVVTGDRFVNGKPLPADFQAQRYAYP